MRQRDLFDESIQPLDPNILEDDKPRVAGHSGQILRRLQMGPATNVQLNKICFRYSARIYDLRSRGYPIRCERGEGGVNVYRLEE